MLVTVNEVLQRIDSLKPNAYSRREKLQWLSTLDGLLWREVMAVHEGAGQPFGPYGEGDGQRQLLVSEPYGLPLYLSYLENRMDHYNGDTARYNNSLLQFRTAYMEFFRWYNRNHRPLGQLRKFW